MVDTRNSLVPWRPQRMGVLASVGAIVRGLASSLSVRVRSRNPSWANVDVGEWDPNPAFTAPILYGAQGPGLLEKVRTTHPILSPAMDRRAEWMASQSYQIVPRTLSASGEERTPSASELACAAAVAKWFDDCQSHTLAEWIAMTYDAVMTYGHAYQALSQDVDGWRILPIDSAMISEIETDRETRTRLTGLRLYSETHPMAVGAVAQFVRSWRPGQLRGDSVLRPMLATHAIEERLVSGVLRSLAASTGAPVVMLGPMSFDNEGGVVASERENIDTFLKGLVSGGSVAATFRQGTTVTWVSSPSQALTQFGPIMDSFDGRTRAAVMATLASLGVKSAGNRALGEVISEQDELELRHHVEAFLQLASGDRRSTGTLLRMVAVRLGFDERDAPRVELRWDLAREATLSHIRAVYEAVSAGIVSVEEARPFVKQNLRVG